VKADFIIKSACAWILVFMSCSGYAASDELVFSTPPTQSVAVTKKNYQPLVDYISGVIHQKIVLKPAKNFREYTKNIRENKYDMIFDGPHFINWRIRKQNHVVVAKQPGELHFAERKSTRLNSSHGYISYAVICLKQKIKNTRTKYD